jgi:hypothetical protein
MTAPGGGQYERMVALAEDHINRWLYPAIPASIGWNGTAQLISALPSLVRIRGARIAIDQRIDEPDTSQQPLLASLRGLSAHQPHWLCLLVSYAAQAGETSLWLGSEMPNLATHLAAMHPALLVEQVHPMPAGLVPANAHQRLITGIPANQSTEQRYQPQLESLMALRGGHDWLCSIWFKLAPLDSIHQVMTHVLDVQNRLAPYLEAQLPLAGATTAGGRGSIQRALDLCDQQLTRLHAGLTQGMWTTSIVVETAPQLVDTVAAQVIALSSGRAMLEPLRSTAPTVREYQDTRQAMQRLVTSDELRGLVTIPRTEQHGYRIQATATFDVDVAPAPHGSSIALGYVVDHHGVARQPYTISLPRMARHVLVAGMTGSGKSNTCKGLLGQLASHRVPFMVIEPAKAEYRSLANVRVFTPGDERGVPMRLNPFEVPVVSHDGAPVFASVQGHIDHLKSVFNAAFILYAPMPYVLERALHDIYVERGWNLTSNTNPLMQSQVRGLRDRVFPTLGDLARRIETLVPELGYDVRAEMDIRAGLLARIASLRYGAKGLLFDCRRSSPPIHTLLERSSVIELEHLASDDEKTFAMGLLLVLLYEYRILQLRLRQQQGGVAQTNPELAHVVLIEEAHRLLGERRSANTGDRADAAGQTIATFSNMLAEMRAYGQGFIIADQIPGQLAATVVKNTEQKIIHRLAARDDRELVGATANLTTEQERFIATLPQGRAVVYGGTDDRPMLVQMAPFTGVAGLITAELPRVPPLPGCVQHCAWWQQHKQCPSALRQVGREIAERIEPHHLPGIAAAAATGGSYSQEQSVRNRIEQMVVQRFPAGADVAEAAVVRACTGVHLVESVVVTCETMYPNWRVDGAELLQRWLTATPLTDLRATLRDSLRAAGPFASCSELCSSACVFRPFAREFSAPHRARLARRSDTTQAANQVRQLLQRGTACFGTGAPANSAHRDLALCLALHLTASHEAADDVVRLALA